jgi:tape measure domain-containing protein
MANNLQLVVTLDNRPANQAIGDLNKQLGGIDQAAIRGSQAASKALEGVDRSAVRVAASVRQSFAGLGAALGVTGLGALAKSVFDLSAGFERSRVGLRAFVGDAKTADALFKDIQKFAESSPFEFKDLLQGGQRLLAFNTAAEDVVPTLKAASAAIGAIGGGMDNFFLIIKALGDIRNRGKVTGEEIRQLANQGVPAIEMLAKGFGVTTREIVKSVEQGIVPADAAIRVLVRGMTEKFGVFDDAVSKTASAALSNFKDAVQRLADDLGRAGLPAITKGINDLRAKLDDIVARAAEYKAQFASLAVTLGEIGLAIVTYRVIAGLQGIATALTAIRAASVGNVWGLIAAGLALVTVETIRANKALRDLKSAELDDGIVRGLLRDGKTVQEIEALARQAGLTADRIQDALQRINGRGAQSDFSGASERLRKQFGLEIVGEAAKKAAPEIEQFDTSLRDAEEAARRAADANKRSADILDRARRGELTGVARIVEEYRQYREELGITAEARRNLAEAQLISIRKEAAAQQRKGVEETLKAAEEERKIQMDARDATFRAERQMAGEILNQRIENSRAELGLQEITLAARRDRELRALEGLNAVTIDQKVGVEQQKASIEERYLRDSLALKRTLLDADLAIELAKAGENADLRLAIEQKYSIARRSLEMQTDAEIAAARENAANQSTRLVLEQNQQVFDRFKRQAEGVFDALVRTSTRGWRAIGDALRTALLTALKDVVTSRVAQMLFQAAGGQVTLAPGVGGGRGGMLGGLAGLLGLGGIPVFGAPGAPGGTPGFAGPVNLANTAATAAANTGAAAQAKGVGLLASLTGMGAQFKGLLTQLGNLGAGTGHMARGITGMKGGGLLAGGGVLVMDGLRRGGWLGLAETAAGGAMIGAKFGGPLGAVIGAAAGGVAGLFRMLKSSAEEKIVKKVREMYGIDIERRFAKDHLLPIIKNQFGGNVDLGLRSPAVRDLLELYQMSRGRDAQGIVTRATASVFASRGGAFEQLPTFQNGAPVLAGGGSVQNITVQLDAKSSAAFLEGRAVQALAENPRVVSRASDRGQVERASRDGLAASLAPSFVV